MLFNISAALKENKFAKKKIADFGAIWKMGDILFHRRALYSIEILTSYIRFHN